MYRFRAGSIRRFVLKTAAFFILPRYCIILTTGAWNTFSRTGGLTLESGNFPETLEAFRRDPAGLLWKIPGIWLLDKPSGPSSNLMVTRTRKALELKRVGHAGTLDPLASGLLILLAGNATRLFDSIQEMAKTYIAEFRLGERTDSQDSTGAPLPGFIPERRLPLGSDEIVANLERFRGNILQVPPMYSALKKDGQPLYKLARKGESVERAPRPVTVYRLELEEFNGICGRLLMTVSKGFYVRTLIDDLGVALGSGAVMTSLRRTQIGLFSIESARQLDDFSSLAPASQ